MNAFDNIIGYTAAKADLEQICDVLRHPEAYVKLGAATPKGLLLHGEPGVGKTLMATSLIAASGRPSFTCRKDQSGSDFIKVIRETFSTAKENAPSIVFLDDLDKFSNCDIDLPDAEEYGVMKEPDNPYPFPEDEFERGGYAERIRNSKKI